MTTSQMMGVDTARADDTPAFALGTTVKDEQGREWVYVQAVSEVGQPGSPRVAIMSNDSWQIAEVFNDDDELGAPLGVVATVIDADQYGWLCRKGTHDIEVGANCAANTRLNTGATPGRVDDGATAETTRRIEGMVLTTARGGSNGPAEGVLNYPTLGIQEPAA